MSEQKNQPDTLLGLLRSSGASSVSIIGMTKNTGKSVTFNHLVSQAAKHGLLLGLTSIGRDGEKRDEVFHTPKPRICAPAGSLLATTRGSLKRCEVGIEILEGTGFFTAMGEVIIGRARESGFVELAGPTLITQHRALQETFAAYGTDLILIDGALDRVSPAAPSLAKGIVLATGAALGPSIDVVLGKTKDRIERFAIPQVEAEHLETCRQAIDSGKVTLLDAEEKSTVLPTDNSLTAGEMLRRQITLQTQTVVLGGAVGDSVLEGLIASQRSGRVRLVIRNGSALFCARNTWRKFTDSGGKINAIEPIRLIAVTLNPVSPIGACFDPRTFFEIAARMLAPYPVTDVVLGCSSSDDANAAFCQEA